ncbi:MAG: hypothetical protein IPP71_01130 [Bacteroidetes bacterium]|nr:hypothetical protein [Bacteroidota bacterium]
MRNYILFFLLFISTYSFAQDIIVLRQGETEIKCHIVELNDTAFIYRKWNTPGTAKYSYKRNEVLSYTLDKGKVKKKSSPSTSIESSSEQKTEAPKGLFKIKKKVNPDEGLLGKYHSDAMLDGFAILASGDTVYGILTIKNVAMNQLSVSLKDEKGVKKEFNTTDLTGYSYANLIYEKVRVRYKKEVVNGRGTENGHLLLHREVDGKAKLYRMYTLKFSKTAFAYYPDPPSYLGKLKWYYVIDNGNGQIEITHGKGLGRTLLNLFENDSVLKEQIMVKSPKIKDLEKIISSYNERQ